MHAPCTDIHCFKTDKEGRQGDGMCAHCEVASLGRRKASSAGPLLTRTAWGTWRLIRVPREASPSDRSERERVETTRDIDATLLLPSSDLALDTLHAHKEFSLPNI